MGKREEVLRQLRMLPVMRPDDRSTTRYEPYVMVSEAMRDEIAKGDNAGWIAVGKRYPKTDEVVLIYPGLCGGVSVGRMEWRDVPDREKPWVDDRQDIGDEGTHTYVRVTHWQPLPESPK